jgi:hypothetical protein
LVRRDFNASSISMNFPVSFAFSLRSLSSCFSRSVMVVVNL